MGTLEMLVRGGRCSCCCGSSCLVMRRAEEVPSYSLLSRACAGRVRACVPGVARDGDLAPPLMIFGGMLMLVGSPRPCVCFYNAAARASAMMPSRARLRGCFPSLLIMPLSGYSAVT